MPGTTGGGNTIAPPTVKAVDWIGLPQLNPPLRPPTAYAPTRVGLVMLPGLFRPPGVKASDGIGLLTLPGVIAPPGVTRPRPGTSLVSLVGKLTPLTVSVKATDRIGLAQLRLGLIAPPTVKAVDFIGGAKLIHELQPPTVSTAGPPSLVFLPGVLSPPTVQPGDWVGLVTIPGSLNPPTVKSGGFVGLIALPSGINPPTIVSAGRLGAIGLTGQSGLSGGDVWYHIYSNTGAGDLVDYLHPIATVQGGLSWVDPAALPYPSDWTFAIRSFDAANPVLEELNTDARVRILLNSLGVDVTNQPAPPLSVMATPAVAGAVRVTWIWIPGRNPPGTPQGFHVYAGTPTISYTTPVAFVGFGAFAYSVNVVGLTSGLTYQIGVRAYNATAEETNTVTVSVVPDNTPPIAVPDLTIQATFAD